VRRYGEISCKWGRSDEIWYQSLLEENHIPLDCMQVLMPDSRQPATDTARHTMTQRGVDD
jgi:hypothetical protein